MKTDVILIGSGAAGLMCALQAGQRGRSVVLLDHAKRLAEKIRISGGGHCNFTNLNTRTGNFISANPDFCRSALARYTPQDFIVLLQKHNIGFHEKTLGQLFCDDESDVIIAMLREECDAAGVKRFMNCEIGEIDYSPAPDDWKPYADLTGVSLDVTVSFGKQSFRENMLVTHRGLSGPAILQISSYWQHGQQLHIDLLPDRDMARLLDEQKGSKKLLSNYLTQWFPKSFADVWCAQLAEHQHIENKPLNQYDDRQRRQITAALHDWQITPSGTVGYSKAEVTCGGIDTRALSSKTMECIEVPGLYFIGEVVDVTGQLGGHNFQWAWASGYAAGQAV